MAIPEDKARVAITMSREVLDRLDNYCRRSGMTRSGYVNWVVAHQLDVEEQMVSATQSAMQQILATAAVQPLPE